MKCKTTGWCAVAFTTGDGSGMRDYDIALGGVASGNNYLDVSGMEIHFSIKNYPPLEHVTDARWVSVLNSFPGLSKCLLVVGCIARDRDHQGNNNITCNIALPTASIVLTFMCLLS